MRVPVLMVLLIGLLVLPLRASAQTAQAVEPAQLHQVHKIYMGETGDSDAAERFSLLLEEQLIKRGFIVVLRAEKADAILVSVLSMPLIEGEGDARFTAQLRSATDDQLLWSGNFGPKLASYFRIKDPLKLLAEAMASRLKKDWDQSAKNSGPRKNN